MKDFSSYRFPFAAFPALRILFLLITGVVLAHLFNTDIELSKIIIAAFFLLVIWLISEVILRNKSLISGSFVATVCYLLMVILFGFGLVITHSLNKKQIIESAKPLTLFEWETIKLRGTVINSGWSQSGREIFLFDADETQFDELAHWNQQYRIRIYGSAQFEGKLLAGDYALIAVRLYAFPERRNPHDFDYGGWLQSQNIVAHGELVDVLETEQAEFISWGSMQERIRRNIDQLFDKQSAPLAKALFLGYKQELDHEVRQAFSRSGLSHIMAVSGLHVGFIVAPFWLIIPWLWQWKWGKWAGLAGLTVLLIMYAGLTGFSASVSRASLMAWLLTYGKLFHKVRHSINLTALAAVLLITINPYRLFEVGFQLSFSAVFIILLLMPEAQRIIPRRYRFRWIGGLASIVIVSVVVQAGLFPILTHYFGEFSVAGPIANALVVPLLSVLVPAGLALSVAGNMLGPAAHIVAMPLSLSISWIESVATGFGRYEHSYLELSHQSIFLYTTWTAAILMFASIRLKSVRWKMAIIFLISLNLFISENVWQKYKQPGLMVTILDVGQGDAIHIETPGGKHLFVDTGRWSPMSNSGDRVLLPYIEHMGIDKIDAVILSHPHADHIGGLPALIENVPIGTIYHSEYPYDSALYNRYQKMAKEYTIPLVNLLSGDIVDIDPAVRLFVLGPAAGDTPHRNPNNHSVVIRLQYGDTSFLLTGDAEKEQEHQLAEMYGDFLDVNVYKAGHHGSRTSSTDMFINYVQPEITAVSLGFRNRYRHPNRDAVTILSHTGADINYTSLSGALVYSSDGRVVRKIGWK